MLKKLKHIGKEKNLASLFSNLSVALSGLISFMLLTRVLNKEQFGDWVLFITLSTFVDLLRFGLTRTAAVRLLSGADDSKRNVILGTTFKLNLKMVAAIAVLCWGLYGVKTTFNVEISNGYTLFLIWYPVLAFANLSWNNAMALFQAQQLFKRMMYVRLANVGIFLLFLIGNYFWWHFGLFQIILVHLGVNFISGFWCTLKQWDGLTHFGQASKAMSKELIAFGKYSMGTLISSSLLKSADTFIIGLSPFLGSTGIAMYAIPLKLTDLLGIPLNSFTMTAYPKIAKKCMDNDVDGARKIFYLYSGVVTLLFFPIALVGCIFAEELVLILGGAEYADSIVLLTLVFRVFTVYIMLLPLDRFSGVFLDSLYKPHYNLYKVIVMTVANIIIDLIAVFVFQSLVAVAIGTVIFTAVGIFLGFYFLRKEIAINTTHMASETMFFIKNIKTQLKP